MFNMPKPNVMVLGKQNNSFRLDEILVQYDVLITFTYQSTIIKVPFEVLIAQAINTSILPFSHCHTIIIF